MVAWVLLVALMCGPWELGTILPTEADCQAVAKEIGWSEWGTLTTSCVAQGSPWPDPPYCGY